MNEESIATHKDRELIASMLDGYLRAAMELSGTLGEYSGSATLIPLEGKAIEVALRERLADWGMQFLSIREGACWTEVEDALRGYLLPVPFGDPALAQHANVVRARRELAWKAADLIMFLSPDHKPLAMHYLQVERPGWADQACAVRYESDVLLVLVSRKHQPG